MVEKMFYSFYVSLENIWSYADKLYFTFIYTYSLFGIEIEVFLN